MNAGQAAANLLAVEVGTSRVKLGWFLAAVACDDQPASTLAITAATLPQPQKISVLAHSGPAADELGSACREFFLEVDNQPLRVAIASVNSEACDRVQQVLATVDVGDSTVLNHLQLPIEMRVCEPNKVGIDRLLTAVAASRMRRHNQPAVVVDLGTAITVNRIDAAGVFCGGAILPGPKLAAEALHRGTATLPQLQWETLPVDDKPPTAVGDSTNSAITAGLYWGVVGAVRQLVAEAAAGDDDPLVVVTGGDAPRLFPALSQLEANWQHVSHLVLAGIALSVGDKS